MRVRARSRALTSATSAQLWDTAGQERFHNVTRTYFRGAAAVLLVYDVTDRDSFQWLNKWRDQVADYVGDINSVVIAVVGNKIDRAEDRVVSADEGAESAKHLGAPLFFETSAKTVRPSLTSRSSELTNERRVRRRAGRENQRPLCERGRGGGGQVASRVPDERGERRPGRAEGRAGRRRWRRWRQGVQARRPVRLQLASPRAGGRME